MVAFTIRASTGMLSNNPSRTECLFAVSLQVCSVLCALCVLCYAVTMLWARHELSQPESVVAAQSTMLARNGTLYYSLKGYPYTVCAYMPIFYFMEALFVRAGLPAMLAGRMISFAALLTSFFLCWRLLLLYTGNRYAAWIGTLLASSSTLLLNWGTTGQVDMLAVTLSIAAFYQFSRFYLRGENTLLWTGLLSFAAFFTKQTMLAAPAAMFVLLLFRNRKTALLFGAALGGSIAAVALGVNTMLGGRFFADTVFANINPFDAGKLAQHLEYFAVSFGALLVTFAASAGRLARSQSAVLLVYFGLAAILFLALASKVGSDSNYQLEPAILLIVCTSAGLAELNFFDLFFRNSKSWITLMQLPVGVFLLLNYRVAVPETV